MHQPLLVGVVQRFRRRRRQFDGFAHRQSGLLKPGGEVGAVRLADTESDDPCLQIDLWAMVILAGRLLIARFCFPAGAGRCGWGRAYVGQLRSLHVETIVGTADYSRRSCGSPTTGGTAGRRQRGPSSRRGTLVSAMSCPRKPTNPRRRTVGMPLRPLGSPGRLRPSRTLADRKDGKALFIGRRRPDQGAARASSTAATAGLGLSSRSKSSG